MKLKSIIASAACVLGLAAVAASSTPKGFTDDLDAALAQAKANGKYVYACFSGSDWCGWCIKLEREVFADTECDFTGSLKNDYLFVFIDSPRDKSLLSEKAKKENPKQVKKYKIRGYPTALVLTGDGELVEETGYRRGGAKAYVEFLQGVRKGGAELIKKNKAKREAAEKREKLEAQIKAKYFKDTESEIMAVLNPLNAGAKTPDNLLKAADELEKIQKKIAAIKIDEADAKVGDEIKSMYDRILTRIVKRIRKDADKKKSDKANQK